MAPQDGPGTAKQEDIFFLEKVEFFDLLQRLLAAVTRAAQDAAVKRMSEIIDKYQEQSHLLDPHLSNTITPVMERVRDKLRAWHAGKESAANRGPSPVGQLYQDELLHPFFQLIYHLCKTRGYKHVIKYFPHEVADLEPAVQSLVCQDASDHRTWETRYVLLLWLSILVLIPFDLNTVDSSMSGPRAAAGTGLLIDSIVGACQCFLGDPGAVRDAAAVCIARLLTRPDMDNARLRAFTTWAVARLAACAEGGASSEDPSSASSLSPSALGMEGAAAEGGGLRGSAGVVAGAGPDTGAGTGAGVSMSTRVFLATGVLQALVETAKHGHRDSLRSVLSDLMSQVLALLGASAGSASGPSAGRAGGLRASPLLRKYTIKLAARTGLTYLPPRIVGWRYSRGSRSLLDNLSTAGVAAAKAKAQSQSVAHAAHGSAVHKKSASGAAGLLLQSGNDALRDDLPAGGQGQGDDGGGGHVDVPAETEDIIDLLLQGLRDSDTVVRWSSAKGVGRVTGRLPLEFADDVVAAVLQLLVSREGDSAWHGGCLALAELARRGLLLPSRLEEVVPLVLSALAYDVRKGSHSVGAHVRDAACYVCWAFARAYAPGVMSPYVLPLARGMLITALFDREVNCRRAAAAAFQENVGRQGHENFPSGIAILTAADYFSLGNRANAYLGVAPVVAAFPAYRPALQEHLLLVKLRHWDRDVRELSARAAASLAESDPAWAVGTALPTLLPLVTSPDIFTRHGAVLGTAEIALALARVCVPLPSALQDDVRNIVVTAEKARAYTGRGGEMVRMAMCRLIEAQCLAEHALSRKAALRLLQTLDDCLKHPSDTIQACAVSAVGALAAHALSDPEPATLDRLTRGYLTRLGDENPAVRRGASLALGALPRSLLAGTMLDPVLSGLLKAMQPERAAYKRDAETRRNAAQAIGDVVLAVGLGPRRVFDVGTLTICAGPDPSVDSTGAGTSAASAAGLPGLSPTQLSAVWDGLVLATRDYAVDNRGDVGSWVRKAAAESMERILVHAQACVHVAGISEEHLDEIQVGQGSSPHLHALLCLGVLDPHTACGGLSARLEALQCSSGYGAIGGYAAGSRLLSAIAMAATGSAAVKAALALPPARNTTVSRLSLLQGVRGPAGAGVLVAITAAGAACQVAYVGGAVENVPADKVQGVPVCTADMASLALRTASAPSWLARHPIVLCGPPSAFGSAMLPPDRLLLGFGTLLRQAGEKLDLLRAVAGDALCRLLHLPAPLPNFQDLPHRGVLEGAFPAVSSWCMLPGQRLVVQDEDVGVEEQEEGEAPAGEEVEAGPTPTPTTSSDVQWSIPRQCFPRLAPVLAAAAFAPYLAEGMVTAVGGLSESVVKHSGAALLAWALEAKRSGDVASLTGLADALAALLQPRPRLPWEALGEDGAGESATGPVSGTIAAQGFDPSLARWFKEILGTDVGSGQAKKVVRPAAEEGAPARECDINSTHKVDVRLVVPALRTLDLLLSCGALSPLHPPSSSFGPALVALVRRRVWASREDVPRVLAAAAVFLGLLSFADAEKDATKGKGPSGPVVPAALLSLLDLLGHPFPRVRKAVAETMYVRMMVLDEAGLAATDAGLEGVISTLAETCWDGDLSATLSARDSLYPAFGLEPPLTRMGTSAADRALADGSAHAGQGGKGGDGDADFSSYGALAREAGY